MNDSEIRDAIYSQGWIELEEPIHNGYYAEWVLRADIARREDAVFYQEALDICKEKIWSKNPEFKYKNRKTKKWEQIKPKLVTIDKQKYDSLSPSAKKFFVETKLSLKYWREGFTNKYYKCTLSYELVIKITKAFITHRREHDGVLYQMDAENKAMMANVAGNGNPWGSRNYRTDKFFNRHENRKKKFQAEREIVDKIKIYKSSPDANINKKLRELE